MGGLVETVLHVVVRVFFFFFLNLQVSFLMFNERQARLSLPLVSRISLYVYTYTHPYVIS